MSPKREKPQLLLIEVVFICPKNGKKTKAQTYPMSSDKYFTPSNICKFDFWKEECDMCGTHSSLDLEVICPECKRKHNFNIKGY